MIRRLAPLLALALAACGSSPVTRYHSLQDSAPLGGGGGAERLVEVLPVAVPAAVDRGELVLTAADGRLDVRESERWAGPLADELRDLITAALWRAARAADVYAAPVPAAASDLPQYRLAARFERFEARGRTAQVAATWTVRRLPDGAAAACRAAASAAMPEADAAAAAQALGEASRTIADAIAASLVRLGTPAPCPPA